MWVEETTNYYYACKNARCKGCDKKNERQGIIDSWVVDEIINQFNLTDDKVDDIAMKTASLLAFNIKRAMLHLPCYNT